MKNKSGRIAAALLTAGMIVSLGGAALAEDEPSAEIAVVGAAEESAPVMDAAPVEEELPLEVEAPVETTAPAETEAPTETTAPAETQKPAETERPADPTPTVTPQAGDSVQALDFLPLEIKAELPDTLKAGSKTKLEVEVKNTAGKPVSQVTLTLWSEDERFAFVPDEESEESPEDEIREKTISLGTLRAGETRTAEIEITVVREIGVNEPELEAKARCAFLRGGTKYIGEGAWELSFTQPEDGTVETAVPADSADDVATFYYGGGDTSSPVPIDSVTPYIIIQSYSHNRKIFTGDTFTVEVTLLNTSQKLGLDGVIASVETSDGIAMASGTNTLFIGEIAKGGTSTQSVTLTALPECKDQIQRITLSLRFEYVDNKERKQGTATEVISLPVYQKDRLELREPTYDPMQAGKEGTVSIPYVNKGRGQLYNVEAVLSLKDAEAVQSALYAGNIESGKNGSLDFIVTPERAGAYSGTVTVTYEDETQQEKSVEIPISFTAGAAEVISPEFGEDFLGLDDAEDDAPLPVVPMAVVGVTALVGAITAAVIHKRKKAKQDAERDTDDWFEEGD